MRRWLIISASGIALGLAVLAYFYGTAPQKHTHKAPVAAFPARPSRPVVPPVAHRAALARFTWQDGLCDNTGFYNSAAYTPRQLRDTYELLTGFSLQTDATVFYLKDFNDAHFRQTLRQLQHEHDSLAAHLRALRVVPTDFWQKMKQLTQAALEEEYEVNRLTLEGYFTPAILPASKYSVSCPEFAAALASPDTVVLFQAWRKLTDGQKRRNGAPAMIERIFQQQAASRDRFRYARLELLAFGWYNCANAQRQYSDLSEHYQLNQHFLLLFKKVKTANCNAIDYD